MNSNRILFEKITNRIEKPPLRALVCLWDEPHVIPVPCGSGATQEKGLCRGHQAGKQRGESTMNIVCLDMEGVLVPEIWIAFAEESGIPS